MAAGRASPHGVHPEHLRATAFAQDFIVFGRVAPLGGGWRRHYGWLVGLRHAAIIADRSGSMAELVLAGCCVYENRTAVHLHDAIGRICIFPMGYNTSPLYYEGLLSVAVPIRERSAMLSSPAH